MQALLSQLTQLQLVIQDLENEKKASAHEASESLLQIKLENKKIYAKLLRQSESAAAEVYIDFKNLFFFKSAIQRNFYFIRKIIFIEIHVISHSDGLIGNPGSIWS